VKKYQLLIINYILIAIVIALRIYAMGWILLAIGLFLIPFVILHIASTTLGIIDNLNNKKETIDLIILSSILFITFFLTQSDIDDYRDYIVIEAYFRKLFNTEYQKPSKFLEYVSWSSGILMVLTDVIIIYKNRRKKNKITEKEQGRG